VLASSGHSQWLDKQRASFQHSTVHKVHIARHRIRDCGHCSAYSSFRHNSVLSSLDAALRDPLRRWGSVKWERHTCSSVPARASHRSAPRHPRCSSVRWSRDAVSQAHTPYACSRGPRSPKIRQGPVSPEPAAPCCASLKTETSHLVCPRC